MSISSKAAAGDAISKIFNRRSAVIGVVHCLPFPGTPRYDGRSVEALVEAAVHDARAYAEGGVDGLIVENHGDIPFLRPQEIGHETTAFMTAVTRCVIAETGLPTGLNVLANATTPALAVAAASGARFIRVNAWANAYVANEGLLNGDAAQALRYRRQIAAEDVAIFADSHVKHGAHAITADRSIEELTRDLEFFDADVVIATGQRTGDAVTDDELITVAGATGLPVVVGSGVTRDNAKRILSKARGVIIGSSLKEDGVWWNPVVKDRVADFIASVRAVREQSE